MALPAAVAVAATFPMHAAAVNLRASALPTAQRRGFASRALRGRGAAARLRRPVCAASSEDFELVYFDARGAAETSRLLFAIAGTPYKDNRYTFGFVDGKPKVEDRHGEDKAAGEFAANLDRLPLLKTGGKVVGQSKAIERYLASQFGLMGADALEAAQVDAFCEHVRDITTAYGKERGSPFAPATPEVEAALDKWYEETLPGWFARLEKAVGATDGCVVGAAVSYADVCLHQLVTAGGMGGDERTAAVLAKHPKLAAIVAKVTALESVQAWEAARPQTPF